MTLKKRHWLGVPEKDGLTSVVCAPVLRCHLALGGFHLVPFGGSTSLDPRASPGQVFLLALTVSESMRRGLFVRQ